VSWLLKKIRPACELATASGTDQEPSDKSGEISKEVEGWRQLPHNSSREWAARVVTLELGTWNLHCSFSSMELGIKRLRTEEQVHISRPNTQTTAYE
jgi:hypothetical protein